MKYLNSFESYLLNESDSPSEESIIQQLKGKLYPEEASNYRPQFNWVLGLKIINAILPKPVNTKSFYHGGLSPNTDIKMIDVFKLAEKQRKRDKEYAGFYMFGEDLISKADGYGQYSEYKTLHRISISNDMNVLSLTETDRLSKTDLEKYKNQGYDIIKGRDVRGWTEYILLNTEKIVTTSELSKYKSPELITQLYLQDKSNQKQTNLTAVIDEVLGNTPTNL